MDKDRVYASRLDVHVVVVVDEHDVVSRSGTGSLGDGRGGGRRRFQADPFDEAAGTRNM